MSLKPSKPKSPKKQRKKAPKKRPYRLEKEDYGATYVLKHPPNDWGRTETQVFFDKETGRYYYSGGYAERYTLIPASKHKDIEKRIRPEGWTHYKYSEETEGGRLTYTLDGKEVHMTHAGIQVWDGHTKGYIILDEKTASKVKVKENWPKDYEWGDESGRVLVQLSWISGGEGSGAPAIVILVDGYTYDKKRYTSNYSHIMQEARDVAERLANGEMILTDKIKSRGKYIPKWNIDTLREKNK